MTVDIDLDGTRRRVSLRRDGDSWIAGIDDGREAEVSIVEIGGPGRRSLGEGGGWSLLVGEFLPPEGGSHNQDNKHVASGFSTAGLSTGASAKVEASAKAVSRKSYAIAFDPAPGGELIVSVNGIAVTVMIVDQPGAPKPAAKAAGRRGARDGEAGAGSRTVVAPMPGRIVRVLVKPDETVSAGQPLVVVEAMKMENELRAPRGGIVAEVRVAEGASVEANTVLVVLR